MKQLFTTALLLCALCAGALEYDLDVKTDKQHWALKAGEKVTFSFQLRFREKVFRHNKAILRLTIKK